MFFSLISEGDKAIQGVNFALSAHTEVLRFFADLAAQVPAEN